MEFRVLGPVEARRDDTRLPLTGTKIHTVLATLLLARGRVVSVDRLSRLLWGWEPPATMNSQIYTYISRLRKQFGDSVTIVRRQPGYALDPKDSWIDAVEYERLDRLGRQALAARRYERASALLHRALELWRGMPLANTTDFLVEAEVPQWEESWANTLECRIEADLAVGGHQELVPELTRLVAAYPLRERLRVHLMTALSWASRQADALAVYRDCVTMLREELGVDPGPELREVHRQILDGVLRDPPTRPVEPAPTGAPTVRREGAPTMLPADSTDFTGRLEPLAEVINELRRVPTPLGRTRHHRVLITGMPGIGKSALAVRAAHLLRGDFPDGQLYADLAGPGAEPKKPAEVLRVFLRSLGVSQRAMPATLDERVQVYRGLLDERRLVVVLDNAASEPQVRPLLPNGAHCRTIITSRTPLSALEGVGLVRLGRLTRAEGLALLTALVGPARVAAEPDAAAALVELCDRLPLALRICGARLAARPQWRLARMLARMAPEQHRLDALRSGGLDIREHLRSSYVALPPVARHHLRQLALLPELQWTTARAAGVLRTDERQSEEVLEELVDARLLELTGAHDDHQLSYRFTPLVRLFVREQAVKGVVVGSGRP
ncbi:BTAD domain-containing putative transcriptional regulator [Streptomyces sp. NPDC092296]|uniref:AfsR/SARP family transcriptional regulator n=1 Tax=Streptomyces sp. NPDC092296 TaxID=3366012 RepID=UPI0038145BAC